MSMIASQITSLTIVYSTVYSDADQRKHQSSASLAFVWGIHRDRWIPRTKDQLRGKCFHLMTSSCIKWSASVSEETENCHDDSLSSFVTTSETMQHLCHAFRGLFVVCSESGLHSYGRHYTVWCGYNAVNFLKNINKIHPIARPLERGMGCLLSIGHLIDILPQFLQSLVQCLTILDRVITTLDCTMIYTSRKRWLQLGAAVAAFTNVD